jgi:hypothetical protein
MRRLPAVVFLAALLMSLAWISPAGAQPTDPAAKLSLAQAEGMATGLKQGMSAEEVQTLLGKPRRTALRNNAFSANAPGQGTLQWTYTWTAGPGPGSSSSVGSLNVVFAAKTPEQWYVNSWEWLTY